MYSISNKNIKSQTLTKKTLDIKHNIKMQQFQEKEHHIKFLKNKIIDLNNQLLIAESNKSNEDDIYKIIDIKDEIINFEKQLEDMNINSDEIEYLVNTGNILFKYYDIIDKGSPKDDTMLLNKKTIVANSILKYLISQENKDNHNANDINDKATLLEKYMECTENNYVKNVELEKKDKCLFCQSANRNIMLNDGIIYCNDCCTVEYIIIDHDRPSYKDPPKEISYFAYKRINHFNELILTIVIWIN
jgi:hypothetical protein